MRHEYESVEYRMWANNGPKDPTCIPLIAKTISVYCSLAIASIMALHYGGCKSQIQYTLCSDAAVTIKAAEPVVFWGQPTKGIHCRLEPEKDIFALGEPIKLGFMVKAVNEPGEKEIHSVGVRELVEQLEVKSSDGAKLRCLHPIGYPIDHFVPVTEYTSVNVSEFFDISKKGEYTVTAAFPSINEAGQYLRSQTIEITVVEKGYINISISFVKREIQPGTPMLVKVKVWTEIPNGICFRYPRLVFLLGQLWSGPTLADIGFPSYIQLKKGHPLVYTLDLSSFGWDYGWSSVWPSKPLGSVLRTTGPMKVVAILSGVSRGRRLSVSSGAVEVVILPQNNKE